MGCTVQTGTHFSILPPSLHSLAEEHHHFKSSILIVYIFRPMLQNNKQENNQFLPLSDNSFRRPVLPLRACDKFLSWLIQLILWSQSAILASLVVVIVEPGRLDFLASNTPMSAEIPRHVCGLRADMSPSPGWGRLRAVYVHMPLKLNVFSS